MEIVWANARVGSNPTPSVAGSPELVAWDSHPRAPAEAGACRGWLRHRGRWAPAIESHPVRTVGETQVVSFGAWLSPVERCVRVAEVPGSNPGAPIEGLVLEA